MATLEQASGTLKQVNGGSLVITTASGQPVTVTTSPQTLVVMSGAPLNDITDGASVLVLGLQLRRDSIAGRSVTVGPGASTSGPAGAPPGLVVIRGTVADASSAGGSVVTASGTPVPVTTSGGTVVTVTTSARASPPCATIYTLGQAGPHGTLSARAEAAVSQLPAGGHISVTVRNCSPTSIAEASARSAGSPPPAAD